MIKIDYPRQDFRIKKEQSREMIFDELRRSWLKLTPEEWVRQNFVRFLISKNYPATLIALEKKILVGELSRRFDILVYNRQHEPWMMVECKSMSVPLNETVFNQVLRYNMGVPVQYLVITNGTSCMTFKKESSQLMPLDEFPEHGV